MSTVPGGLAEAGEFKAPAARRNNFDALRLGSAMLVLYGHQTMLSGVGDETGTVGLRLLVFFAISGFLVTGSWAADPHPGRFLVRRFLRVWPAFAAVIVVCAALAYVFAATNLHQLAAMFYLNNLYFRGVDWSFFSGRWATMNQSLWMVPYEVDLYLALTVVAVLGRRVLVVVAALALLAAVDSVQPTIWRGIFDAWSPFFAGFFAAGVLFREFKRLRHGDVVLVCVLLGVAAAWFGVHTLALLLIIPPSAVWIGMRSWPILRSAARFGDLSLGVFLWGWPIQQLTRLWLPSDASMALQLAVVIPPVLGLAWLSWRFIESPALRLKPAVPKVERQPFRVVAISSRWPEFTPPWRGLRR